MKNLEINILMLGDIIGNPGLEQIYAKLPQLLKKENINLAIANGENSDNGFGITDEIIHILMRQNINVITTGNHIWSNSDAEELLEEYPQLLRPHNYPEAPGKGYWIGTVQGLKVGVANLIGRYFMTPVDCPFQILGKLLKNELNKCDIILVDFHAELTQEKLALAHNFDGKITFLAGTHTHVQTADEQILPKGTGFITDLGLCGGVNSIIGMDKNDVIAKLKNNIHVPYTPSAENEKLQGIIIRIDHTTKKINSLKRISI